MTKDTMLATTTMLREYAENRWFTGENKVSELKKAQDEELEENWSVEMANGEHRDEESELYFKLKENEEEREQCFAFYSKKYHEIHDLIKLIEAEQN